MRRKAAERKYRKQLRIVRLLWLIAGALLAVLLVETVVALCFSPRFWIYRITVTGTETLTDAEVVRLMALPPQSNFYRTSLGRLAGRIEAEPRVAAARVRRDALGVLVAEVRERQAVCRLGYGRPALYLDAKGYLFTRPTAPQTPAPVVEGVKAPAGKAALGQRVTTSAARQVLACLDEVAKSAPQGADGQPGKNPIVISRVNVARDGAMTLVLKQGTRVFLGEPSRFRLKIWTLQQCIVKASADGYALDQIDYFNLRPVYDQTGKGASMGLKARREATPL